MRIYWYYVMFFIYSVNLNDLTVDIHDYSKDFLNVNDCLDRAAKSFIKREQGERAAIDPYRNDVPDAEITDDGYFLRKNNDNENQIDVFHRKTKVQNGYVYNSYDVEINKVCQFGVSESNIDFSTCIPKVEIPSLPPPPPPPMPQIPYFDDLKSRLAIQREKLEMNFDDFDSDSDSDTDFEYDEATSLLTRLRKKAQLTIDVPETTPFDFDNLTLAYKPDSTDQPILNFNNIPPVDYHPLHGDDSIFMDAPNVTPTGYGDPRGSFQSPIDFSNIDWGTQTKAVTTPFNFNTSAKGRDYSYTTTSSGADYTTFGNEEFPFLN